MILTNYIELTSAAPALTLLEAKRALSIAESETAEDPYLSMLIQAATNVVEAKTRRALVSREFELYLDGWPGHIILPKSPVTLVTSVKYYDGDGVLQTLATNQYVTKLKSTPAIIKLAYGCLWPTLRNDKSESVIVRFTAGYGASESAIPNEIKVAILFLVNHWWLNREPITIGPAALAQKIPVTFDYIISSFKVMQVV